MATISRRQLLGAGGTLGAMALLSACGSTDPGGSDDAITIWNNLADAQQNDYFRKHFAEGYRGKYPVRFSPKADSTIDRLIQTALAAGSGPSVIVTPGPSSFVSSYWSAGYLADLGPYVRHYGWTDKFAPWALSASQVDGKLVTLPASYETMVFYWNPATLDKLGLAPPKTLEEFESFCSEAKGKGHVPLSAGNADYKGANEWFVGLGLNHGAGPEAVHSALRGETKWTDPVFVDAIDRLATYFKKGWFGGGVDLYFTNNFPTTYQQLASGKAAGMLSGTWDFSNLGSYFGKAAGNDATWDWTTVPSLGKGVPRIVWDLAIGQSVGINTNFRNTAAAADYLNFLTTDLKTIIAGVERMNFEPPPIHISAADFSAEADPRIVRLYSQLSAARSIGYTTWTFFPQQTETYMIDYFENVITGRLSAKAYCAGIESRFSRERAEGRVPVAPKPGGGLS
ncbi:ABC transporter substrate-binding protein [Streptomyces iranensis]|uniref:Extracellular solute-binding protein family 1 n=1 Tax=Streptomyces iranensis TaxID=576784 RepID=A0A060ZIZ4_9ACTN|nr:ABC transporter substrate-binding protein [Streptomyces iranensis]MBP2063350.1 raffinose/stachyose/melibiose transport system substrate-binding protein [Streptomyces iranensis]CDR01708.1 extracellular solute-binding protein family 1 [Streptomyces iranensis]